jgi:hypothetical protein
MRILAFTVVHKKKSMRGGALTLQILFLGERTRPSSFLLTPIPYLDLILLNNHLSP